MESRRKELDSTLSDLLPAQRIHVVSRAVGGLRSDLKRASLDGRTARLRDLDALRRRVDDAKAHYNSGIQMIMREGLGSERRSRLVQQLEHSGHAAIGEVEDIAERAMIEDRAFETGRSPGERTIGLALRARDRAALGIDPDSLDDLAE